MNLKQRRLPVVDYLLARPRMTTDEVCTRDIMPKVNSHAMDDQSALEV